jgi:hypothetical protein
LDLAAASLGGSRHCGHTTAAGTPVEVRRCLGLNTHSTPKFRLNIAVGCVQTSRQQATTRLWRAHFSIAKHHLSEI